ncbi:MAG: ATP-binding protein [Bacteroidales bacterium]|jgi:two-component system phosphate regulon sensor histidine kinase PhoR|nr:ATP-binding protein [Bacteroidales bacterium]
MDLSDSVRPGTQERKPADHPAVASLLITLVIIIVAVIAVMVFSGGTRTMIQKIEVITAAVAASVALFFLVRYIIMRYIESRLDAIYRIIQKATDKKRSLDLMDVEKQVLEWARDKESEIKTLRASEEWRKEFVGNVSHELKTPIFNLQGLILTLLDGGLEDKTINRLYLRRAEKSINRLIAIVEDLQTISRLESDANALNYSRFSLPALVDEVIEANEVRAADKKITLHAGPVKEPCIVEADRKRIFQALSNLVVNSVNYGKQGGRTDITMTVFGGKVLVEVTDDGIGIEEEHLPRVFERFYRVEKHRSRDSGGTGLGLAIVKHAVEAHGHKVMVKSRPGEGSTFSFTLSLS